MPTTKKKDQDQGNKLNGAHVNIEGDSENMEGNER
jgi:hypothetical protein